jgi:hypothetical protein
LLLVIYASSGLQSNASAVMMAPLDPLVAGYIAARLTQGSYDKLSSVNLDVPGLESLISQRLIEEALSLVHQRSRELEAYLTSRSRIPRSQNDIQVTLGHLEPHSRALNPSVRMVVPGP